MLWQTKKVNFTRKQLDIPSHVYRQLIESREQLAQLISTEFNSVSIVPDQSTASQRRLVSSKDHRVCIMGVQQEVDQVIVKLQQRIDEFIRQETLASYKTDIKIPNKYEPHIIGKKGANLNRIREQFGVKIEIIEAIEGENEFTVTVQGLKKHADGAIKELREMRERLADSVVQRIKVPTKLHSALIGPQGRYVRRLEENYQVRIRFPRGTRGASQSDDDEEQASLSATATSESASNKISQAPDEVIISGGRKGVAEARAEMQELIEYEQARSYVVKLDVAARHLPFIMGKRGARINELRDETNTQIDIKDYASSDDDTNTSNDTRRATIAIQGQKTDVERARRRIEAIVNEQEDQCTLELDIPIEYHRQLIGAGGARIRELVQQCGGSNEDASMVRFPKPHTEDTIVVIRGQRAVAQKVHETLKALVDEQLSRHTLTLKVPTADRPTIIGQQGKTMKALESDYNVKIDLRALDEPDNTSEDEAMTLVSISGEESNCEKARTAIQVNNIDGNRLTITNLFLFIIRLWYDLEKPLKWHVVSAMYYKVVTAR
jgi:predicted PilT family ATPase